MPMTPIQIEATTRAELMTGTFPYDDCRWLTRRAVVGDLSPDLATFFSNIVGFASTASHLEARAKSQLQEYRPVLQLSFFELHPMYEPLAAKINEIDTPRLSRQLHFAELIRLELLPLLDAQLATTQERQHA